MGRLPKPYRKTTTLGALYRKYLLEDAPEEDFIKAAIRTESVTRLMVLSLTLRGYSPEQISGAFGNTRQAVNDMIRKTMRKIWKTVNNKPRYYLKGHPGGKGKTA
jgi:hypothetical protein